MGACHSAPPRREAAFDRRTNSNSHQSDSAILRESLISVGQHVLPSRVSGHDDDDVDGSAGDEKEDRGATETTIMSQSVELSKSAR